MKKIKETTYYIILKCIDSVKIYLYDLGYISKKGWEKNNKRKWEMRWVPRRTKTK